MKFLCFSANAAFFAEALVCFCAADRAVIMFVGNTAYGSVFFARLFRLFL